MSKLKKIELNHDGIKEYLQSESVQDVLKSTANLAISGFPGSYDVEVNVRKTRAVASIKCADEKTYYSNRKHNYLVKAIKGGNA
jgi:hypothetical protein